MVRPRFSIATAIGLIVTIGLGLAALRGSSALWSLAATLVLLASLLSATVGAFLLRGRGRAFGNGFAVFGWTLLFLLFLSTPNGYLALEKPDFPFIRDFLSLRSDSNEIVPNLHAAFHPGLTMDDYRFERIFLVELNLLFALLGGFVVRSFASRPGSTPREEGTREARRDP